MSPAVLRDCHRKRRGREESVVRNRSRRPTAAAVAAGGAFVLGVAYAGMSAYWGSGGIELLDTIGGSLERAGRSGNAGVIALAWVTAAAKALVAVLGLAVVVFPGRLRAPYLRLGRVAAWCAAVVLVGYGGVLTVVGLLVQSGVLTASASANHQALAWHAYLWDPWFLLWGFLLAAALAWSPTQTAGLGPYRPAPGHDAMLASADLVIQQRFRGTGGNVISSEASEAAPSRTPSTMAAVVE